MSSGTGGRLILALHHLCGRADDVAQCRETDRGASSRARTGLPRVIHGAGRWLPAITRSRLPAVAFNHMADDPRRERAPTSSGAAQLPRLRERIDAGVDRADRYPEGVGVLILDLDKFKKYNDSLWSLCSATTPLQRVGTDDP